MLRLRLFEIRRVMKAEITPYGETLGIVPSCSLRRAHQHTLERSDHRVSVKGQAGVGKCGQGMSPSSREVRAEGFYMAEKKIPTSRAESARDMRHRVHDRKSSAGYSEAA